MTRHHRLTSERPWSEVHICGPDRPSASMTAWGTALRSSVRGRSLVQTTVTAAVVGSILFMINLYSQVREGPFTVAFTARIALTYLVPWFNATLGIAIGLRAPGGAPCRQIESADPATPPESAPPSAGRFQAGPVER